MRIVRDAIALLISALIIWGIYYLWLPPVNLASPAFWFFLIVAFVIIAAALFIAGWFEEEFHEAIISACLAVVCVLVLSIGAIVGSPMCNSNAYYTRLSVADTTFESEFENVNWDSVPQIDAASAQILGSRKMGTLVDEISQYDVSNSYTLINCNGKPIRIAPLGYAGLFKYNSNKNVGIPGYVTVDCVTKTAEFVRLDEGIQYSPSAFFSKDLKRHLRGQYPSKFFEEFSFEIDDNGTPYYVVPTYRYAAGIGGAKVPDGCILVNPITGASNFYVLSEVPEWVDHSISDELAVDMINSWGKYESGWLNSWISQKNVRQSTKGNNFVTLGNDVYLYTGITSVAMDESNIGFILVNMRTSESKYFEMPSAEEYSAMDSAKGQVQHLGYSSTFPILINLNGEPTYFLSLKDAAGLVKMYALVSVENIQKLAVTDASLGIDYLVQEYSKAAGFDEVPDDELETVTFTIANIYTCVVEGNTQYYFEDSNGNIYMTDITQSVTLPVLVVGDEITVTYSATDIEKYFSITSIT